jgi:hypothetical protein
VIAGAVLVATLLDVDLGARAGVSRPWGAFDQTTHVTDTTFGSTPLGIDGTIAFAEIGAWKVYAGATLSWAPTIPTLCDSFDDCMSTVGTDVELLGLLRFRGPRTLFFFPQAELGAGWSWSARHLANDDVVSSRAWNGPVLGRLAFVPTFRLGSRTRLGVVFGGSIARSAAFELDAPGVHREGLEGARLHGTFDLGLRFGWDVIRRSD